MHEPEIWYQDKKYTRNGDDWLDPDGSKVTCKSLIDNLNNDLDDWGFKLNLNNCRPYQLVSLASQERADCNYERAEAYAVKAHEKDPESIAAATVLSAIYRDQGKSEQAVRVTDPYKDSDDEFLLTTRAAALCDLGRCEEAYETINRAIDINNSEKALHVSERIKAECS